jgi:hypothetical protein
MSSFSLDQGFSITRNHLLFDDFHSLAITLQKSCPRLIADLRKYRLHDVAAFPYHPPPGYMKLFDQVDVQSMSPITTTVEAAASIV